MKLNEILNTNYKSWAIATCTDRAIPSLIDGLKPVQRFLLLEGMTSSAKTEFNKVAAIGSSVAKLGYEHGEASSTSALINLTAYHSNNIPLFTGKGNFGNKLEPEAAAPRYIFCKLSNLIPFIYKDNDLTIAEEDEEIKTPKYYLPIIPMVLVNGQRGLAAGFATLIPPHNPIDIIDYLLKERNDIRPCYPLFEGKVDITKDAYILHGTYTYDEKKGKLYITEIPNTTMMEYDKFLHGLQEKGTIRSYENNCTDDHYNFEVSLRTKLSPDNIEKTFKLVYKQNLNLTVVTEKNVLKVYDNIYDIVKDFYDVRIEFIQKRIDKQLIILQEKIKFLNGFIKFIKDVITKKLDFLKIKNNSELSNILKNNYEIPEKYISTVSNSPLTTLTQEKIQILEKTLEEAQKQLDMYKNITKEELYKQDLLELKEKLLKQ